MNFKPTILVSQDKTVFQSHFLENMWKQYFNIEIIDINKTYNPKDTIVVSNVLEFASGENTDELVLADRGLKHAIDHCWDAWDSSMDGCADLVLRPIDFFWINEHVWYKNLGYDKLDFTSSPTRDFLLLMNLEKPCRTKLYNALVDVLPNNVYSYVGHGIPLQNAQDTDYNETTWQRYTDPDWYTGTRFSVVSESMVCPRDLYRANDFINVNEKTLKPCAFMHPFIVWGQPGTLAWQKRQGFETFDHCVDESYDANQSTALRFNQVIEQINICIEDKTLFTDSLTQQKLLHNRNHFYNENLISDLTKKQIIDPLLELIDA